MWLLNKYTLIIVALALYFMPGPYYAPPCGPDTHVIVTGASSGIGLAIATKMHAEGFHVVATVRKEADRSRLLSLGLKEVLILDVTAEEDIQRLRESVSQLKICALVNNAGINDLGPFEYSQGWLHMVRVNVIGLLRVTQVLLPKIRQSKGRIVNVGSVQGEMGLPTAAVYSATKFAVRGFSDGLRHEVPDVHVSTLEPGFISSGLTRDLMEKSRKLVDELADDDPYRKTFDSQYLQLLDIMMKFTMGPVSLCENAVLHAVTSTRPQARYLLTHSRWSVYMHWLLPDAIMDHIFQLV